MNRRSIALASFSLALGAFGAWSAGCGSDVVNNPSYGEPADAAFFNPGQGSAGSGYGSGGNSGGGGTTPVSLDAGPPQCADSLKTCGETFTLPFNNETSVELRGSYAAGAWASGTAMTVVGSNWTATVQVPWGQAVEYKFFVNGTTWETNPSQPMTTDDAGDMDNLASPITCPNDYTCTQPGAVPAGVFDWRDAVLYFVFIDRFLDGDSTNNCNVAGASTAQYTSANYLGGDWVGATQKIDSGYFNALGVNTLWITVPVKNADGVLGAGIVCNNGTCTNAPQEYTGYHGYWPSDLTTVEPCFGSSDDLLALVQHAHAKGLKVLFDFSMVNVHETSAVYQQHQNDGWFTTFCQCGNTSAGCSDYSDDVCWFAPYLPHFDYSNADARNYSVNAALGLVQTYGNDAFRLDAIKQVNPAWLAQLRPAITSLESQVADGGTPQHFYMVGETFDYDDMSYIASFLGPDTALDGQFDFPLRYRIADAVLLRDTSPMLDPNIPDGNNWTFNQPAGMKGLASFMDYNDAFYQNQVSSGTVVMSTFVGNQDLPRSIHLGEQTIPSWLGGNAQAAATSSAQSTASPWAPNWTSEPAPESDATAFERLANAFAVIMTNRGAPLIYYGDEIGLSGAGDPDNRRMMPWTGYSAGQTTLLARMQSLGQIRAAHPAMRRGTRTTLYADADLWVYSVSTSSGLSSTDTAYVAINRSDAALTTTAVPAGFPELLAGGSSTGNDSIPARQTRIFSSYVASPADAGADGG